MRFSARYAELRAALGQKLVDIMLNIPIPLKFEHVVLFEQR